MIEIDGQTLAAGDCHQEYMEYRKKMEKAFVFTPEDGYLTINIAYEYNIHMDRIKTRTDLLAWVVHLCEKNWMDADYIQEFILRVCCIKGWEINRA